MTGRRLRGTILAVPTPNGEWVYPACQFGEVDLLSGIDAFVRAFAADVDPWTKLSVLSIALLEHMGGAQARGAVAPREPQPTLSCRAC